MSVKAGIVRYGGDFPLRREPPVMGGDIPSRQEPPITVPPPAYAIWRLEASVSSIFRIRSQLEGVRLNALSYSV